MWVSEIGRSVQALPHAEAESFNARIDSILNGVATATATIIQ
jgi:hypothetical protein